MPERTETDRLLNVPGQVTVGDRVLTVAALSQRMERALWAELTDVVAREQDPFQRIAPLVARLDRAKLFAEKAAVIQSAADMAARGVQVSADAVSAARRTLPEVLATELYRRAKPFHPELTLRDLQAVITVANVAEVWLSLEAALGGEGEADDPKA